MKADKIISSSEEFAKHIIININVTKLSEEVEKMEITNVRQLQRQAINMLNDIMDEMKVRLIQQNGIIYFFNNHYWMELHYPSLKDIVIFIYTGVFDKIFISRTIIDDITRAYINTIPYIPLRNIEKSYLNFLDGVYDIKTNKKVGNSDMYLFKHCINFNFSDVLNAGDCPNLKKFLYDVCHEGDKTTDYIKAKIDVILSFMCYALFNNIKIERALVLHGDGGNGKSTLINIIRNLYGDYNISSVDIANIDNKTKMELFAMRGKMLNMCSELKLGEKTNVEVFKRVISKEPISARRLYSLPEDISDFPVQIFATNSIPHLGEVDKAISRRLTIIEFKNTFKEDPYFIDRFKGEYPAMLKYILSYKDEIMNGRIKSESELKNNTKLLLSSRNSIEQFLLNNGNEFGRNNTQISLQDMYNRSEYNYLNFCRMNGYKPYAFNSFVEQIRKILGIKVSIKKSKGRIYHYIDNNQYTEAVDKLLGAYGEIEEEENEISF